MALESQWIGTPVVVTAGGGTQESLDIGASGWLIDLVDADTMANVVLRVLADFKMQINGIRKGSAFHRIAVRHGSNVTGIHAALWACAENRFDPDLIMTRVMDWANSRVSRDHIVIPRQYLAPSRPPHR